MLLLRLTTVQARFYLTPTRYDDVGCEVSLPFLIPEPFKEKQHGSCTWFMARSDDGKRLMIGVSSLGTRSLFVGLNYPINREITDGKDHDGSAVSFIRCVHSVPCVSACTIP